MKNQSQEIEFRMCCVLFSVSWNYGLFRGDRGDISFVVSPFLEAWGITVSMPYVKLSTMGFEK